MSSTRRNDLLGMMVESVIGSPDPHPIHATLHQARLNARASRGIEIPTGLRDAANHEGVFHRRGHDEVNGPTREVLQCLSEPEIGVEEAFDIFGELHENVEIAALRVEVLGRRGAEHREARDTEATAEPFDLLGRQFDHEQRLRQAHCGQPGKGATGWSPRGESNS